MCLALQSWLCGFSPRSLVRTRDYPQVLTQHVLTNQLLPLLLPQVPLYALNQHLVFKVLQGLDMGGSITIHAFGAYYGLAASLVLSNGRQAPGAYTSANIKNSAT